MSLKKGDIIDERKQYPESCGLMIKVMAGGEGFEKVVCCGHELTTDDVVPAFTRSRGRKRGQLPPAVVLDETKLYPDSCGLRVMIMDGGAGFQEIICCGHSLTLKAMKELQYGEYRESSLSETDRPGHA